jgi:hypothetical protein
MAAAVIISSSMVAAALVLAVFAVLATYAEAGGWLPAKATWYGAPNGAGPDDNGMHEQSMHGRRERDAYSECRVCLCVCAADVLVLSAGGACGYKNTNKYPYLSMTSCGNEPLFKGGKGCGACYQVRCTFRPACENQSI